MTNEQAIEMIQNRISELVQDDTVRNKMIEKKQNGSTNQEIQQWVTELAIGTLVGIN